MKRSKWIYLVMAPTLLISINTLAHDPSEHMKIDEKADCSAMQDMDHGKMDMNDPVMQAMMQKCMHKDHGIAKTHDKGKGSKKPDAEHKGNGHPHSNAKANEHSHTH